MDLEFLAYLVVFDYSLGCILQPMEVSLVLGEMYKGEV